MTYYSYEVLIKAAADIVWGSEEQKEGAILLIMEVVNEEEITNRTIERHIEQMGEIMSV